MTTAVDTLIRGTLVNVHTGELEDGAIAIDDGEIVALAERPADREIEVAGIIAQRAHGGRHEQGIRDALPEGIEYFGRIAPHEDLEIPDRHLGLWMGEETPLRDDALDAASEHLLADRLLDVARAPPRPEPEKPTEATEKRIGVAQDAAVCFKSEERLSRNDETDTFIS